MELLWVERRREKEGWRERQNEDGARRIGTEQKVAWRKIKDK